MKLKNIIANDISNKNFTANLDTQIRKLKSVISIYNQKIEFYRDKIEFVNDRKDFIKRKIQSIKNRKATAGN